MTSNYTHARIMLFGLCLWSLVAPASAVQFRLLGWANQDVNLHLDVAAKPVELMVPRDQFSLSYEAKPDKPIILYKMVEVDGKPQKQIACSIPVPPGMVQGLIILSPGDDRLALSKKVLPNNAGFLTPNAPLIYNYTWIDDSPTARPSRSIELLNFSGRPVAVQLEARPITLAPQATASVHMLANTERMPLHAASQVNGQWKMFVSLPLRIATIDRIFVFFRDSPAPAQLNAEAPKVEMLPIYDWPQPTPGIKAQTVASQ